MAITKKNQVEKIEGFIINGKPKSKAFMIEENHPAIGRILIIENQKYKILDDEASDSGTYIAPLKDSDELIMEEYDEALDLLSEKLIKKVDIKRLIKENIKHQTPQEIQTGLYILKKEEDGEKIEEEHHRGCYEFKMFYKNQKFSFWGGHLEER